MILVHCKKPFATQANSASYPNDMRKTIANLVSEGYRVNA